MIISFEQRHSAGHKLRYCDNWGGSSSNEGGSSTSSSGAGAGSTGGSWGGYSGNNWGGSSGDGGASAAANIADMQSQQGLMSSSPNLGTWSVGKDGHIYGNLQNAAKDLGLKASEMGPNGGIASLSNLPGLAGILGGWFANAVDEYGIPSYAMTPQERQEFADRMSQSDHGGNSANAKKLVGMAAFGDGATQDGKDALTGKVLDSLIHDPSNTAQTGWDRWLNVDQPWMDARLGKISSSADTAAGQMGGLAINSIEDYNNIGRPAFQNLSNYVNRLGNADYQAQQRGLAMEGVDNQFNLADQAAMRRAAGLGMGSGALAAVLDPSARAMAKVKAATDSDQALNKMYGEGLGNLSSLGLKLGDFATNNAKGSLAATSVPFEFGSKLANDGFKAAQTTGQILDSRTNAAANTTAAATGRMNADTARNDSNNSLTNTLLGVGASAGLKWLFG